MALPPLTTFRHRPNRNGSHDSICLTCFKTVLTKEIEEELVAGEETHLCELTLMRTARLAMIAEKNATGNFG